MCRGKSDGWKGKSTYQVLVDTEQKGGRGVYFVGLPRQKLWGMNAMKYPVYEFYFEVLETCILDVVYCRGEKIVYIMTIMLIRRTVIGDKSREHEKKEYFCNIGRSDEIVVLM